MLKSELVRQAYAQIRISGLTTVAVPEEITRALEELDQLMYRWYSIGRDVNYNFPAPSPDGALILSDPNDLLGIYPWAITGVTSVLAKNLVEYYGKPVPDPLARKARAGLNTIMVHTVKLPQQQYPRNMPRGSGNQIGVGNWLTPFYFPVYGGRGQSTPITLDQNLDMTCDFTNDLAEGDAIASYTIEVDADGGLTLQSDSRDGNVVYYRVLAASNRNGTVTIVATTDNGLVIPKAYCFATRENTCVVTLA